MEKIKSFIQTEKGKDIMVMIIVILVGLCSFELGRLSKDTKNEGIQVEYPNEEVKQEANAISALSNSNILQNDKMSQTVNTNTSSKNFFASSRGSKYYSVGCSAGKSIKQENRIYFETKEEAERAGYALSSSCR